MLKKSGFTLSEVLIAICVVGIISALLIATIAFKKPNKNKALIRKDYYLIEKAISNMMIENDYFPMDTEANGRRGFAHPTNNQIDPTNIYNIPNFPSEGLTVTNPMRFCYEFTNFLNVVDRSGCSFVSAESDSPYQNVKNSIQNNTAFDDETKRSYNFKLPDGSEWIMTDNTICDPSQSDCSDIDVADITNTCFNARRTDLTRLGANVPYTCLFVDTNGFKEPPNYIPALDNTKTQQEKAEENDDRDRFVVIIGYDGRIQLPTDDGVGDISRLYCKNALGSILKSKLLF